MARSTTAQDFRLNGSYFNPFKRKRKTETDYSHEHLHSFSQGDACRSWHFWTFALLTEIKSSWLSHGCSRCDLTPSTLQFRLKISLKHNRKMTWMQTVFYLNVSLPGYLCFHYWQAFMKSFFFFFTLRRLLKAEGPCVSTVELLVSEWPPLALVGCVHCKYN